MNDGVEAEQGVDVEQVGHTDLAKVDLKANAAGAELNGRVRYGPARG
jgi:hypothetical protein